MSLRLYMDVHVRFEITSGLRSRQVEVITAQEDGTDAFDDSRLLNHATDSGCVLFSQDADFLIQAVSRQRQQVHFNGVIYSHQLAITIGQAIDDLELIAKVMDSDELADRIIYLPLK